MNEINEEDQRRIERCMDKVHHLVLEEKDKDAMMTAITLYARSIQNWKTEQEEKQ
jgi:hypothetical protein